MSNAKGTAHKSSLQEDDLEEIEEGKYDSTLRESMKSQDQRAISQKYFRKSSDLTEINASNLV